MSLKTFIKEYVKKPLLSYIDRLLTEGLIINITEALEVTSETDVYGPAIIEGKLDINEIIKKTDH